MLIKLLDSHPDVYCENEIFFLSKLRDRLFPAYLDRNSVSMWEYYFRRKRVVYGFLDWFYGKETPAAIGFKFMYSQARYIPPRFPAVIDYLHENNITIIHNVRENYLSVLVSRELAKTTGVYHSEVQIKAPMVMLDPGGLLQNLTRLRDEDRQWAESMGKLPYLRVTYEDLISNQKAETRRVLDMLGVQGEFELKARLRKVAPKKLGDAIENYDAVRGVLSGTEFETCLDEYNR